MRVVAGSAPDPNGQTGETVRQLISCFLLFEMSRTVEDAVMLCAAVACVYAPTYWSLYRT
jgi:hypothetical protein